MAKSTGMTPTPFNERYRLLALYGYNVLDTPPEPAFDRIVCLAARIFQVPICLISLVDPTRQWFKAVVGLEARETPREVSFCGHAIIHQEVMQVPDAAADPRFADNALVTGDPGIRFYAGTPLVMSNGHAIGTLCVIDRAPRTITANQRKALEILDGLEVDFEYEGEMHADHALNPELREQVFPNSRLNGNEILSWLPKPGAGTAPRSDGPLFSIRYGPSLLSSRPRGCAAMNASSSARDAAPIGRPAFVKMRSTIPTSSAMNSWNSTSMLRSAGSSSRSRTQRRRRVSITRWDCSTRMFRGASS